MRVRVTVTVEMAVESVMAAAEEVSTLRKRVEDVAHGEHGAFKVTKWKEQVLSK